MTFWLIVAGYVLLGIGTARTVYAIEYAAVAKWIARRQGRNTQAPSHSDVHREMEPVGLWPVLGGTFWPLALVVGLGYLVNRVFGSWLVKWWNAPVNRRLRKAGLL